MMSAIPPGKGKPSFEGSFCVPGTQLRLPGEGVCARQPPEASQTS